MDCILDVKLFGIILSKGILSKGINFLLKTQFNQFSKIISFITVLLWTLVLLKLYS